MRRQGQAVSPHGSYGLVPDCRSCTRRSTPGFPSHQKPCLSCSSILDAHVTDPTSPQTLPPAKQTGARTEKTRVPVITVAATLDENFSVGEQVERRQTDDARWITVEDAEDPMTGFRLLPDMIEYNRSPSIHITTSLVGP